MIFPRKKKKKNTCLLSVFLFSVRGTKLLKPETQESSLSPTTYSTHHQILLTMPPKYS